MAVSGAVGITRATLLNGRGAINDQRGLATWGANYVFHASGAQEDFLLIADELANLSVSGAFATDVELAATSGAITNSGSFTNPTVSGDIDLTSSGIQSIASANNPLIQSGFYMQSADGTTSMQLVIYANGLVSGIVA